MNIKRVNTNRKDLFNQSKWVQPSDQGLQLPDDGQTTSGSQQA